MFSRMLQLSTKYVILSNVNWKARIRRHTNDVVPTPQVNTVQNVCFVLHNVCKFHAVITREMRTGFATMVLPNPL